MKSVLWGRALFIAILPLAPVGRVQHEVLVSPYSGPISPASAEYMARGIAEGEARSAAAVILQLDTPADSTRPCERSFKAK
jgi:membrane-bound ClpP family serine protease